VIKKTQKVGDQGPNWAVEPLDDDDDDHYEQYKIKHALLYN
jgi:hypothetical protein